MTLLTQDNDSLHCRACGTIHSSSIGCPVDRLSGSLAPKWAQSIFSAGIGEGPSDNLTLGSNATSVQLSSAVDNTFASFISDNLTLGSNATSVQLSSAVDNTFASFISDNLTLGSNATSVQLSSAVDNTFASFISDNLTLGSNATSVQLSSAVDNTFASFISDNLTLGSNATSVQLSSAVNNPFAVHVGNDLISRTNLLGPSIDERQELRQRVEILEARIEMLVVDFEARADTRPDVHTQWPEAWAVLETLRTAGFEVAYDEIREAVNDLIRSDPDLTGSVQHSVAGLESAARAVSGRGNNLGTLLRVYHLDLGLDEPRASAIVKQVWSLGSAKGRHLREGGRPNRTEANAIVSDVLAALGEMLG